MASWLIKDGVRHEISGGTYESISDLIDGRLDVIERISAQIRAGAKPSINPSRWIELPLVGGGAVSFRGDIPQSFSIETDEVDFG